MLVTSPTSVTFRDRDRNSFQNGHAKTRGATQHPSFGPRNGSATQRADSTRPSQDHGEEDSRMGYSLSGRRDRKEPQTHEKSAGEIQGRRIGRRKWPVERLDS